MLKLLSICFALLAGAAVAKDATRHIPMNAGVADAWHAVGRLDIDGSGFCTATLIAENMVLTAAHCLYSGKTNRIVHPEALLFKAGFRNGTASAIRKGRRFIIHNNYVHKAPERVRNVPFDIAVIELDKPIRADGVIPFDLHKQPQIDQDVTVISYARGRANTASMEKGCKMFNSFVGALIYTCDVDFGSSGAPVFVNTPNGPQIASVITSKSKLDNKKVALGAPLENALGDLLTQLAQADPSIDFDEASQSNQNATRSAAQVSAMLSERVSAMSASFEVNHRQAN